MIFFEEQTFYVKIFKRTQLHKPNAACMWDHMRGSELKGEKNHDDT